MKRKVLTAGLVCSLFTTADSFADGFRNPPDGGKAQGKAGVRTVFVEDASAISHNPARLTGLKQPEVLFSGTAAWSDQDYDSPAGSASTKDELKFLPNLYAAMPALDEGVVAGVGITTPFGQSTVWEKDSVLRYRTPYFGQMKTIDINPTVAKQVNDRLSVGVGLNVYWSELTLKQSFPWSAVVGGPAPDGRVMLKGDGYAAGVNAGLAYRVADKQTVGVTYRQGFDMEYEGRARLGNFPAGFPGGTPRSDFEADVEFPAIVSVGYGIELSDKLRVEAQVEWLQHSSYETLRIDTKQNNALLGPTEIPQDWDDTWTFGLGADYKVAEHCTLRAGYSFIESPIPDRTYSPSIADSDRHVVSVGGGYDNGKHFVDVAYAYSFLDERDISNNQNPAYNGHYEYNPHLLTVSYGRRF